MPNQLLRIRAVMVSYVLAFLVALVVVFPLGAQVRVQKRPLTQVTAAALYAAEPQAPQAPAASKPGTSGISNQQPDIPVDQIIKRFAEREAEFKAERDNYTYTQTFLIQEIDDSGRVSGEYRLKSEIVFNTDGKRYENVTFAPQPTLQQISLTQEDLSDLEHLYPFVLTTADLPKYEVKYVGHEPLDELNTFVFEVGPKTLEKNQRYFQGRIWVDDKDLQIVKTFGTAVGYAKKKNGNEQIFPHFETFRENVAGKFWFPTYTRADEVFHFTGNDAHIRMTVRFENYKRFGVTIKITTPTQTQTPAQPNKNSK